MRHDGSAGLGAAMRILFENRLGADVCLVVRDHPAVEEKVHSALLAVRSAYLRTLVQSNFVTIRVEEDMEENVEEHKDVVTQDDAAVKVQALVRGMQTRAEIQREQGFVASESNKNAVCPVDTKTNVPIAEEVVPRRNGLPEVCKSQC